MTADVVALVLGLAFAGAGGELFVRAAVGLAGWARVPARLVAATVAAFATSSPELGCRSERPGQESPSSRWATRGDAASLCSLYVVYVGVLWVTQRGYPTS